MMKLLSHQAYEKRVLVFIHHTGHLDFFEPIAAWFVNYNFTLISPGVGEREYYQHNISSLENSHWVVDIEAIKPKISSFDLILSYHAQNVRGHKMGLEILDAAKEVGLPTGELQHGLFQLGFNSYHEPSKGMFFDESLPSKSQADFFISWFADYKESITVGYPPFTNDNKKLDSFDRKSNTVILFTNLHWGAYSQIERLSVLTRIIAFINRNRNYNFLWKRHHGERNSAEVKKDIETAENLLGVMLSDFENLTFVDEYVNVGRLVRLSSHCISTVSTVLLDIEMYNRDAAIIVSNSTSDLVCKFNSYVDFSEINGLEDFRSIDSGYLRPFEPTALESFFDKLWS